MPDETLCIDTEWMETPGLITTWLLPHAEGWLLIETGPQKTIERVWSGIERVLTEHGGRLTDVLVTHIHLDHSGGAGWLQRRTGARIHVHPRGARHLIDPTRIVRGARMVFGDAFDFLWEEPEPAPGEIVTHEDDERFTIGGRRLRWLDTPGHAWHHAAILDEATGTLYTGDVAGVRLAPQVATLRHPTVPPDFDYATWRGSLERLRTLAPERVVLTHGGRYDDAAIHLETALELLDAQVAAARTDDPHAATEALFAERLAAAALQDPELPRRYEMIAATPVCVQGILMARG